MSYKYAGSFYNILIIIVYSCTLISHLTYCRLHLSWWCWLLSCLKELHSWWMTGARSPTRGFIHRNSSPSPQSQSPLATEKRQPGQPNCQGGACSWMGQERRAKGETLGCGGVEKATGPAGWVMSDFPHVIHNLWAKAAISTISSFTLHSTR